MRPRRCLRFSSTGAALLGFSIFANAMDKDYFEGVFPKVGKIGVVGGWGKNIAKSYQTVTDIPTVNRLHLSNILRKLYRNKAEGMAGKIVEWFDRIDSFHIRRGKPLPQHLKKDLFFAMGFMHGEQVMWKWAQDLANDSHEVLDGQDGRWYRRMQKLLEQMQELLKQIPNRDCREQMEEVLEQIPNRDSREQMLKVLDQTPNCDSREQKEKLIEQIPNCDNREQMQELLEEILERDNLKKAITVLDIDDRLFKIKQTLYETFALRGRTGILVAENQLESLSKFKSRGGQKVPDINHDIQVHLRDDLAYNLKNRREKQDGTLSNNNKACKLLIELARFFGVEMVARLRRTKTKVKYRN